MSVGFIAGSVELAGFLVALGLLGWVLNLVIQKKAPHMMATKVFCLAVFAIVMCQIISVTLRNTFGH